MPRFVILRHQPGPNSTRPAHWDLMFERGDVLRTFVSYHEPQLARTLTVEQIADHRPAYLDYQGPVSGGRGEVKPWDAGEFQVVAETPERWVLEVHGQRWTGRVAFSINDAQRWSVGLESPSTD